MHHVEETENLGVEETQSQPKKKGKGQKEATAVVEETENLGVEETQSHPKKKGKKKKGRVPTAMEEQEEVSTPVTEEQPKKKGKNQLLTDELSTDVIEPSLPKRERKARGAEPIFVAGTVVGLRLGSQRQSDEGMEGGHTPSKQVGKRRSKKDEETGKNLQEKSNDDICNKMSSDSDDEPAVSHGANGSNSRRTGNLRILESSSEEEEEGKENKEENNHSDSEEDKEEGEKKTKHELTSSANKRKIRRY
jgi:hypothetical protein